MSELAEFLQTFGGWGVSIILGYVVKFLYGELQKKDTLIDQLHASHKAEKKEDFKLVLEMTEEMGVVLSTNTEQTRTLSGIMQRFQDRAREMLLSDDSPPPAQNLLPPKRKRNTEAEVKSRDGES